MRTASGPQASSPFHPLNRSTSLPAAGHRRLFGRQTGAQAVADALLDRGVGCVFGIPGAQENELWDEFKARGVPYLLVTHEFSAACMADGYARATGTPGVLCVVPGPGVTNALTGLGEALLDSVPLVAVVGDVANGDKYRPFQVHSLDTVALLKPAGFTAAYALLAAFLIRFIFRQSWRAALSVSLISAAGFWLVFVKLLRVQIPAGPWGF